MTDLLNANIGPSEPPRKAQSATSRASTCANSKKQPRSPNTTPGSNRTSQHPVHLLFFPSLNALCNFLALHAPSALFRLPRLVRRFGGRLRRPVFAAPPANLSPPLRLTVRHGDTRAHSLGGTASAPLCRGWAPPPSRLQATAHTSTSSSTTNTTNTTTTGRRMPTGAFTKRGGHEPGA